MEMDMCVQAIPDLLDACCQTEWKKPCNAAIQYEPQVMSEEDATTIMQSEGAVDFLNTICPRVELSLQQNEIMDVFVDDYRALSDTDGIVADKSDSSLKEYQSFTDLKFSKDKPITWIDWHPIQKGIVAVSCVHNYDCDERIELYSKLLLERSLILIWSFVDPIHPQLFLEAPDAIACFRYNPTNPTIIAGGCVNGQIVIWDVSTYEEQFMSHRGPSLNENKGPAANLTVFETDPKLDHAPIVRHSALSAIEFGHKKVISDIQWIPSHMEVCSKTFQIYTNTTQVCNQLITCSIDGSILIWDTRPMKPTGGVLVLQQIDPVTSFQHLDLSWKPFLKVSYPRSDHPGDFAATRVSLQERQAMFTEKGVDDKPSADATKELLESVTTQFYIGTEDGEVVYCDWKPVKDQESGKLTSPRPDHYFTVHSGAITCLERSPFFKNIILSVGGWTFAIWKEAIKSDALLKSASSLVLLTGGTWSPTRPGVFFIIKANGNLEVWDLMDRSHVPYLSQNVSPLSLTTISVFPISNKQLMLGVGDLGGTLHILEVPWSLRHPSSHEVTVMESFFDREVKRLEFVGERQQLRNQQKKEIDAALVAKEQESKKVKETDNWESKAKTEYEDYLNLENALLIELGLREVPQDD
ncbi:dynein axonemal intermediate chain 3-like isoform X2 [Dysidea avara]